MRQVELIRANGLSFGLVPIAPHTWRAAGGQLDDGTAFGGQVETRAGSIVRVALAAR